MNTITLSEFRNQLQEVMEISYDQHQEVIIKRPKGKNMVVLALRDYEPLKETTYLLSTKANAEHLKKSMQSLRKNKFLHRNLIEE